MDLKLDADASPEYLEALLKTTRGKRREIILCHSRMTPKLFRLALDSALTRGEVKAIALNPSLDQALMLRLLGDEDADVRRWIAQNRSASMRVIEVALIDKDSDVRSSAAGNPNITRDALRKCIDHVDWRVRKAAFSNPGMVDDWIHLGADEADVVCVGIAGNPCLSPDLLIKWYGNRDVSVRQALMSNPCMTPIQLERGILDSSWEVRLCVVSNPNVSERILYKSQSDRDRRVALAAKGALVEKTGMSFVHFFRDVDSDPVPGSGVQ